MSPASQSMLNRFAVAASLFAIIVAAFAVAKASGGSASAAEDQGPVPVALSEFSISPKSISVPKGGSIELSNTGTMAHNVAVTDTDVKSPDIAAGGKVTLDVSSLAPGTYEIFCAIAGHKDSGMTGTLTITSGDTGGGTPQAAAAADTGSHTGHEVGSLEPSDPAAKRINKELEKAMTKSVNDFLDNAKKYQAGTIKKGNQEIKPQVKADGTKVFNLTAAITDWEVSEGKVVKAWTYNGQVPGPYLKVDPGDKVEVKLRNELPVSTDIHWHGISVPFEQDGVAPITQDYIRPYETYTYKFTAPDTPELGMYHAHMHGQEAVLNGLFAAVQVGEIPLPEGRTIDGIEVPKGVKVSQEFPMVLNDAGVIGLSLNGKSFPSTEPIVAKKGEWLLIHYYNEGLVGHPMHLHRQPHLVVAKDGFPLEAPYRVDTVWVSPGERYSILVKADEVGTWAFHCHILNHAETNDGLAFMVTAMIVQ